MSLIRRLFGKTRFRLYADSFARTRAGKYVNLRQWIQSQQQLRNQILILTHFESTFLETTTALQEGGLDFEILAQKQSPRQLVDTLTRSPGNVIVTMSQMLAAEEQADLPENSKMQVAIMVTERYPLSVRDQHLESFARNLGLPVNMGYLMSFEDAVVRSLLGDRFVLLMEQLGLGKQDLVQSLMAERALKQRIRKVTEHVDHEVTASSPEAWLQLNLETAS